MFTGLIEEQGNVSRITTISGGKRLRITASKILDDLKVDDSVAVNGVCLTATQVESGGFWVDAVGETLSKSTLKTFREGMAVNLERALRLSDRLGGHLVQGHVNGIGRVTALTRLGENYFLEITVPPGLTKYLIDEGSIAIDGISLTIAKLQDTRVGVSVIPHTWKNTNLVMRKTGDSVNIETDVIGKFIEKLLNSGTGSSGDSTFSDSWFKKLGY